MGGRGGDGWVGVIHRTYIPIVRRAVARSGVGRAHAHLEKHHEGTMTETIDQPRLGERFDRAFALASEHHRSDLREGTNVSYLSHLANFASLMLEEGGDEGEVAAGMLYDALEDYGDRITADDLRPEAAHRNAVGHALRSPFKRRILCAV